MAVQYIYIMVVHSYIYIAMSLCFNNVHMILYICIMMYTITCVYGVYVKLMWLSFMVTADVHLTSDVQPIWLSWSLMWTQRSILCMIAADVYDCSWFPLSLFSNQYGCHLMCIYLYWDHLGLQVTYRQYGCLGALYGRQGQCCVWYSWVLANWLLSYGYRYGCNLKVTAEVRPIWLSFMVTADVLPIWLSWRFMWTPRSILFVVMCL